MCSLKQPTCALPLPILTFAFPAVQHLAWQLSSSLRSSAKQPVSAKSTHLGGVGYGDPHVPAVGRLAQTHGVLCSAKQPIFAKDDRIIVVEGDMVNLTGRVERLGDDGLIYVRGDLEEMRNAAAVPFKAAQLSKYFAVSRTGCRVAASGVSRPSGVVIFKVGQLLFVTARTLIVAAKQVGSACGLSKHFDWERLQTDWLLLSVLC